MQTVWFQTKSLTLTDDPCQKRLKTDICNWTQYWDKIPQVVPETLIWAEDSRPFIFFVFCYIRGLFLWKLTSNRISHLPSHKHRQKKALTAKKKKKRKSLHCNGRETHTWKDVKKKSEWSERQGAEEGFSLENLLYRSFWNDSRFMWEHNLSALSHSSTSSSAT